MDWVQYDAAKALAESLRELELQAEVQVIVELRNGARLELHGSGRELAELVAEGGCRCQSELCVPQGIVKEFRVGPGSPRPGKPRPSPAPERRRSGPE